MNFLTKHLHSQITKCSVTCQGKARTHQNNKLEHGQFHIVNQYIKFPKETMMYLKRYITPIRPPFVKHKRAPAPEKY